MKSLQKINWGIIGCGDVTEVKSGPAFSLVEHSSLVAVMRRDAEKAKDYASRHGVTRWYSNAQQLINDPEVNAIYIATPPSSHEEYTIAALAAGKPVYVEKPMATDSVSADRMAHFARENSGKLVVAHYRRAQPYFKRIRQLISEKAIGDTLSIDLKLYKTALTHSQLADPRNAWRVDPAIAGGGLFHDLAPHQLDILYWIFGDAVKVEGVTANQSGLLQVPDSVNVFIEFESNVEFSGSWNFNAEPGKEEDQCVITGTQGKLRFSFFGRQILYTSIAEKANEEPFPLLKHVQEPMILQTVQYFRGQGVNPCSGEEGTQIMQWIDKICR